VEQLFAFLLLRGQTTVTEAASNIVRKFVNARIPTVAEATGAVGGTSASRLRLPPLCTLRARITTAVRQAWAVPIRPVAVNQRLDGASTTIHIILPSDHVRRDFEYRRTYDLFFLAGARIAAERRWHPEFCDSRFCRD